MSSPEPIHDLARGDIAVSRQLSRALQVIMAGVADPQLKKEIRAILDGRGSARELMRSDAFNLVLDQTLPAAMQQFADMPEEERERLAAQGRAQLDQLRNQPPEWPVPPRTAEPPPPPPPPPAPPVAPAPAVRRPSYKDQVVTPDEPDEDDLYFGERRKNGWLQ